MATPHREAVDYRRLREYLRILSVPNRLELLRKLQLPHTVAEVQLPPGRRDRERSPQRSISRQAIERHLRTLQGLGLVHARAGEREGRGVTEFVVHHARLFALVEELRKLSLLRPVGPGMTEATEPAEAPGEGPALPAGPALVLVSGPTEGAVFPLAGPGPWIVGRRRDARVALPYDPYVSKENTRLLREGGALLAETLPRARNGTRVNWRLLAEGERAPLRAGDVLGVGRSLLVVRGA